jgi:hypothetical protein
MKPLPFPEFLDNAKCILGEGAVIERLRRNSEFELDPEIVNSAFIYDQRRRNAPAYRLSGARTCFVKKVPGSTVPAVAFQASVFAFACYAATG